MTYKEKLKKIIPTKKEFTDIIKDLQDASDFQDEINVKARRYDIEQDNVGLLLMHQDAVILLLEKIFDTDMISWWIYEINFGREYETGCVTEADGTDIYIPTAELLYDYLIKEMEADLNE